MTLSGNVWFALGIVFYAGVVKAGLIASDHPLLRNKRSPVSARVRCLNDGKFYRDPDRNRDGVWSHTECSKYHLCIDGDVFEFKCSTGLMFDIQRQICDFKFNVHNCEMDYEPTTPRPLLNTEEPICAQYDHLACADRTCLPKDHFCDGIPDCYDKSDEGWCDANHDPNAAASCNMQNCTLPDCFCSRDGTMIPGGLDGNQIPQMVVITFDDAVNSDNWPLYERLFNGERKNPNGCPIHATFYLSHEYTNYAMVQKLWNVGHELGVHSITHRTPERWWGENATIEDWFDEMVGMANIVNRFAGVAMEDLRGVRVPFLRVGWNRQFLMMREFGFVYDSSMTAPPSDPPLWPYTLDYRPPHDCLGPSQMCPSRSFPGIWEMVMNQLKAGEYSCAMMDSCPPFYSEEEAYDMLMENFHRHYTSNRAPFGLYFHTIWFKKKQNLKAFVKFLDEMTARSDVYIVTNWEVIQWMQDPTPITQMQQFQPWLSCKKQVKPEDVACNIPKSCKLKSRELGGTRYLHTCYECPETYPWIKNEFGLDF